MKSIKQSGYGGEECENGGNDAASTGNVGSGEAGVGFGHFGKNGWRVLLCGDSLRGTVDMYRGWLEEKSGPSDRI